MTPKAKKPSTETIEGDAVEKPASAGSSEHKTATPATSNNVGKGFSVGIITALSLAFISVAVALFSLYQSQNQNVPVKDATAEQIDALTLRLADLEKIVDENKLVDEDARRDLEAMVARQAEAMPKDDITGDEMTQRLAALADRLAVVEDSMSEVAVSEVALPESVAPEISSVTDATSEIAQSDKTAPAVETDSDRLLSRVQTQPAQPISVLSQASLVAVSGLLADNMAGRPVKQWYDILQALGKEGALDFDMEALSGVLAENPPSRADLLDDADQVIAAIADNLQTKDADESLLGQAGAKLGKLVNLRATDLAADTPAGQLAAFEEAVTKDNFDAALQMAQKWQGRDVPALTTWQAAAMTRHQLDATIMQLVAAVLADMAEAQ
jgi:hypothetical protein